MNDFITFGIQRLLDNLEISCTNTKVERILIQKRREVWNHVLSIALARQR